MEIWRWMGGIVRLRLTGADLSASLTRLMNAGVILQDIRTIDELHCEITVARGNLSTVRHQADAVGDDVTVLSEKGLPQTLKAIAARPVLVAGIFLLLVLELYLPGKVLFFKVTGNEAVPTNRILEAAESCGLAFGATRREIRSEKIKNTLLEEIPQLQWVGVNTKGCVATISVRERKDSQKSENTQAVSSIVAARDGVISSITATRGNPLCKVGQAVRAGEILISGYTDCGLTIHATKAEGEVYAYTTQCFRAVTPSSVTEKGEILGSNRNFTLIIGKKRINFSKRSGISAPNCDKMISQYHLILPGGFHLPVMLEVETLVTRDSSESMLSETSAAELLSETANSSITQRMVAGKILQADERVAAGDGVYFLDGEYACMEMIGQVRKEEIYGAYDRTDR